MSRSVFRSSVSARGIALLALTVFTTVNAGAAKANPAIVVDAATGDVLYAEEAATPWYPASLTKLMTFYIALSAVRDHKISLDTPIVVSARANAAAPSKMGFKPGTEVTLGNALKMLVVKSANDMAIAIAEAIGGSVEAFAEDMNATAAELGMHQSHFVNPNGLPDPAHVSSAHDLAVLARAIYVNFPQEAEMFSIGALQLGDEIIPTHNNLLGRYPGADGMKTGFTCAAGFNLVASAERGGHRYIAIVLGAPNVQLRMVKTAVLLDRAFDGIDHPQGKLDEVAAGASPNILPHDMHNEVCRRRTKAVAAFQAGITQLEAPLLTQNSAPPAGGLGFFAGTATAPMTPVAPTIATLPKPHFEPVAVFVGPAPGYQGPVAQARPAHSPIGTPSPTPEPAATTVATKPQPGENSEEPVDKTDAKIETAAAAAKPHRHVAHKAPAKGHAHRLAKAADKTETKPEAAKSETTTEASKADAAAPLNLGPAAPKHAPKKRPVKTAQKPAAKKHLAKHEPAEQSSAKPDAPKAAAPAPQ